MTTFDDWFEQVGAPSLFDQFSETVRFQPVNGGPSRSMSAIIGRRQRSQDSEITQDHVEEFEVESLNDPTDETFGGITALQIGDSIMRATSLDPDTRPIAFTGEYVDRSGYSSIAIFTRTKRVSQGRGR